MFGLWYIAICLAVIALVLGILMIVYRDDWDVDYYIAGFIITCLVSVAFVTLSITLPIKGKQEVEYFRHQSEYVATAVENGSDLENIAITQTIIEQNEWLANAKADLAVWGTWSIYYGTDLEELEPIVVRK